MSDLNYSDSPGMNYSAAASSSRGPEPGSSPEFFNVIVRDTSQEPSGPVRGSERPPELARGHTQNKELNGLTGGKEVF